MPTAQNCKSEAITQVQEVIFMIHLASLSDITAVLDDNEVAY